MTTTIQKVKEYNKKMGYEFFKAKRKAEIERRPLPSIGNYIIYGARKTPRKTGWIIYERNNPAIRGIGTTKDLAMFRYKQAKEYHF